MNLGIEYLIRSGLIKELFSTPCSLFARDMESENKVAITIHRKTNHFSIKHWNLVECDIENALPPMTEFITENVFVSSNVVLPNYRLFGYIEESIPTHYNSRQEPMSSDIYFRHGDNLLNSRSHDRARTFWLWQSFVDIYLDEHYLDIHYEMSLLDVMELQQITVKEKCPKLWKYWNLWKKYMLLKTDVSGELIFKKFYA